MQRLLHPTKSREFVACKGIRLLFFWSRCILAEILPIATHCSPGAACVWSPAGYPTPQSPPGHRRTPRSLVVVWIWSGVMMGHVGPHRAIETAYFIGFLHEKMWFWHVCSNDGASRKTHTSRSQPRLNAIDDLPAKNPRAKQPETTRSGKLKWIPPFEGHNAQTSARDPKST